MLTVNPGQTTTLTAAGLPTGVPVGFQVLKAVAGTIAIGRTTTGVFERPAGSGIYVITFVAPAEGDLYLVVMDWTGGVLAPETTRVEDLQVSAQVVSGSSGMGAVADYVRMNLGGETFKGLRNSPDYGAGEITRAIEVVKARVMKTPVATLDEATLPVLVIDYLAILASLELVTAARDFWGSVANQISTGAEQTEIVTYANRAGLVKELRDDLMRRLHEAQRLALPLIANPVLPASVDGPDIDEVEDMRRTTADPRSFPSAEDFPYPADFVDSTPIRIP